MTERNRNSTSSTTTTGYSFSNTLNKMENELSPRKTMLVVVIVVGCFAVLWPKVFYPMLMGSVNQHIKPSSIDKMTGCCDVISETDINTIKIMNELCGTIIKSKEDDSNKRLNNKEIVRLCRQEILETCGIDISAVLQEQVRLGQNIKQILDEIRSLNGSLCLKYNYGIAPWRLGVPHRITIKNDNYIRQERPHHLRSELIHPAFRERGRAIPQPQQSPKSASTTRPPPRIVEGRPGPIPGMRPTIGGAGHVVPPSKQGTSSMSVIMPIYTIGIVIFFTYTLMKIIFRKQPEGPGGGLYPPIDPDPHFRKEVFEADRGRLQSRVSSNGRENKSSKLVVNAMSALLDEVDQEIEARRKSNDIAGQDLANGTLSNGNAHKHHDTTTDDQPTVKVLGMEMRASCEGGQKWSRPSSPILPTPSTPQPPSEPVPPPQEIYLEGALPAQSHLLVSESATEPQPSSDGEDPAVVLAGKMTLSVISLDSSENGGSNKSDEERQQLCDEIDEEIRELETHEIASENVDTTKSGIQAEPEKSEAVIKKFESVEAPEDQEEEIVQQANLELRETKPAFTDTENLQLPIETKLESKPIKEQEREQEVQVSAKSETAKIKEPEAKIGSQSELELETSETAIEKFEISEGPKEQVEELAQLENTELLETKPAVSVTEKLQLEVQSKLEPEAVKEQITNQTAQISAKSEIGETMLKTVESAEPETKLKSLLESQIELEPGKSEVVKESEIIEASNLEVQTVKHIDPELVEVQSEAANVEVLESEHQAKSEIEFEPPKVKTTETEEKPLDTQINTEAESEVIKATISETESVKPQKETEQLVEQHVDKTEPIQEFVEEPKEIKNTVEQIHSEQKSEEKHEEIEVEAEDVQEEVDDLINKAVQQIQMLQEVKTTAEIEELVEKISQASSDLDSDEEVEIEEIVYTSNEEEENDDDEDEEVEEEQKEEALQENRSNLRNPNRAESSEHKRVNGHAGGTEESKHTTTTSHTAAEHDISDGTDEEVEDEEEEEIIEIVDDEEDEDEEEEDDNGDIDLNHIAGESD